MSRTQTMQDSAEREARSEQEYPSITRRRLALKASPHGCKKAREKALVKAVKRMLVWEITVYGLSSLAPKTAAEHEHEGMLL